MDSYELKFNGDDLFLLVTVSGELNASTDSAIDTDMRIECEKRNTELLLIDIRPAISRLTGLDNHFAALTFRQRMGGGILAIAIIEKEEFADNSEMYESTAVNRGSNLKFFTKLDEAKQWLAGFSGQARNP